jgi:hypothetical protein
MDLLGFFFKNSKSASLTLLVSLVGGLCWSHTKASKPLVIVKNTLELPKFNIFMQCYDNKMLLVALFWLFLFQTGFARTLSFFARFARTLPGSYPDLVVPKQCTTFFL